MVNSEIYTAPPDSKEAEASRLTGKLGLIVEKQRTMDQWLIRLRRKTDMVPVFVKRGRSFKPILSEMVRWLRKEVKKETTV